MMINLNRLPSFVRAARFPRFVMPSVEFGVLTSSASPAEESLGVAWLLALCWLRTIRAICLNCSYISGNT
jgi:hypothetical protein